MNGKWVDDGMKHLKMIIIDEWMNFMIGYHKSVIYWVKALMFLGFDVLALNVIHVLSGARFFYRCDVYING